MAGEGLGVRTAGLAAEVPSENCRIGLGSGAGGAGAMLEGGAKK